MVSKRPIRAFLLSLFLCFSAWGCAHHAQAVLSIERLGCASCLDPVTEGLEKDEAIESVRFDREKVEIHIRYDSDRTDPDKILALAKEQANLRFVMGAGKGSYPEDLTYAPEVDVQTIVKAGEEVDVEKFLAPGKITIVDFSAKWCGPCRALGEHIYDLLVENPALALRKIEIVDWDSPISKRYLIHADELPYVRVYDGKQSLVGDMSGYKPELLEQLLEKAAQ